MVNKKIDVPEFAKDQWGQLIPWNKAVLHLDVVFSSFVWKKSVLTND